MSARLTIDGSASGAIKAVQLLNEELKKTGKQGDEAARSTKRMEEAHRRLAEQADPMKKLTRQVAELKVAVDAGNVSVKQATTTAERYGREYRESLKKIREHSLTAAAAQKSWTQEIDEAIASAKRLDTELATTGKTNDRWFGSSAVMAITQYAAGVFSIGSALATISGAFNEVERRAQAASDKLAGGLGAAGELAQLGPDSFARGMKNADRIRMVTDPATAIDMATNLEQSGMSAADIDRFIGSVVLSRLVKPENATRLGGDIAKFRLAFGAKEAGSIDEIMDKTLAVSNIEGVQTGWSETINQTLKFAQLFAQAGFSDEQSLAAFAGAEAASPSADYAAEALKSFGVQINKRGLVSGDLFGTVANVESKMKGGKTAYDILGEQNAVIGLQLLQRQREFINNAQASIDTSGGAVKRASDILTSNREMGAQSALADAKARNELAQPVTKEALFEALQEEQYGLRGGGFFAFLKQQFSNISDVTGQEDTALRFGLLNSQLGLEKLSPKLETQISGYLKDIRDGQRSRATTRQE